MRGLMISALWLMSTVVHAGLTPEGDVINLGTALQGGDAPWVFAEATRSVVVWPLLDGTQVDIISTSGELTDTQLLNVPVQDAALRNGHLALLSGRMPATLFDAGKCQIAVLNLDTGSIQAYQFPTGCGVRPHQSLAWVDDQQVALAMDVVGVAPIGPPVRIVVGFAALFDLDSQQQTPINLTPGQQGQRYYQPTVASERGQVVWSYGLFNNEQQDLTFFTRQLDSSKGLTLSGPLSFGNRNSALASVLLNRRIVQLGVVCNADLCGQPAILQRELNGLAEDPDPVIVIALDGDFHPAELSSAYRSGDHLLAQWRLDAEHSVATSGIKRLSVVLDGSGRQLLASEPLAMALADGFFADNQINDNARVVLLAPRRVLIVWRQADSSSNTSDLRAQVFVAPDPSPPPSPNLTLDSIGVCGEAAAWVVPRITGSPDDVAGLRVQIRASNTAPVPAIRAADLQQLAEVGTAYNLIETASESILDQIVLRYADAEPCTDQIRLEALSNLSENGLFQYRVRWLDKPANTQVIEIRINDIQGPLFARSNQFPASRDTGLWVRNNMAFLMLDGNSGEVVATAIARPPP